MFSETSHFNHDFDFIDSNLKYKTSDLEPKLEKILKIQDKNIKKGRKINILIILDDIQIYARSKQLINLSTLGRHYLITVILSLQYPKQLCSSAIRNNLDYVFISDLGEIALKSIYDSIHLSTSFKEFQKYVDTNNINYQFILYDGRTQDRKERLKLVKAIVYEDLKMEK